MKPTPCRLASPVLVVWIAFAANTAVALTPTDWRHTQALAVPQAGLVRVDLPAATLDGAQPDLRDLRILDPTGVEVSFLIERPLPKPEAATPAGLFQTAMNPGVSTTVTLHANPEHPLPGNLLNRPGSAITLRLHANGPVAAVRLETPAARFVKAVKVESSSDGVAWSEIAASKPIFRLPGGAENLRVDFPETSSPWLRLTIDDRRDEPIPFSGALLISPGADAPTAPLAVKINAREESPGLTRLSLDLGAANLPVASLQVQTASPLLTRSVSMAEPQIRGSAVSEQTVTETIIYRVEVGGRKEERLDIPVEKQIGTREVLLLIHNEDSTPLAIAGVTGTRRLVRALFYAGAPGKYTLLTGNNQCAAPQYDLASLGGQLSGAAAANLEPGPLEDNPGYHPPEALGALAPQGAAIDPASWKFRKLLPVAQSGAQQVELDPEVLAHASPDLGDLRIVQAGRQVPFLLERTSNIRTVPLSYTAKNVPDHPSESLWELRLPQAGLPLGRVTCLSHAPLFQRTMRLWEEVTDDRGGTYQRELGSATWNRVPGEDARHPLVLTLDDTPQTDVLSLETDNGDNGPIELDSFQGNYPLTRVIFKTDYDPAHPVWLYYGNQAAAAPSYDLRLVSDDLLRAEQQPIAAGPQEGSGSGAAQASEALTGASRYVFWGALALVVLALLAVTAKLLPKENESAPPPPNLS